MIMLLAVAFLYSAFLLRVGIDGIQQVISDKILGCNGLVRSDVPIDFSKLEIKLISREGNLKDKTECAPNNGYFFLPLYDKGIYTLQISSIHKWIFEPSEVRINFDGVSDPCSRGNDIIFHFKGFRVFGKVNGVGDRKGPKGILLTLVADLPTEQKEVHSIQTAEDGNFDISPVSPGSYILKASHPKWRLSKSLLTFTIKDNNFDLPPNSLLFVGFDVSGSVVSNGEPINGVHFVLFANADTSVESHWLSGCNTDTLKNLEFSDVKLTSVTQLCYTTSNDEGVFSFHSVPSGNYVIVPFYRGINSLKFDVHPRMVRFSIQHDSYIFSKPFQVSGFSVFGRVLSNIDKGKPIAGVEVILGKEKTAKTNEEGVFIFEGVKSGIYLIQLKSNEHRFVDSEVRITPNSATLENIYPIAFKVCGTIQKIQSVQVTVTFVNDSSAKWEVETNEEGDYCAFLPSGNYTVNVIPSGSHSERVLWFFPVNFRLCVTDEALKNISFQQKTAHLVGSVMCADDNVCGDVSVVLRGLDPLEDEYHEVTKGGKYKFTDLYPGSYELSVLNDGNWCWEFSSQRIDITKVENEAVTFVRIGISFTVSSSHNTTLKYKKLSSNDTTRQEGILNINEGIGQYCLPGGFVYQLEPMGCHRYAESIMRWKVGQDSLMLTAVTHEITGFIVSSEIVQDLHVNIYTNQNKTSKHTIGPLKATTDKQSPNEHIYEFKLQAADGEELTIIPESSSLLFIPASLMIRGTKNCMKLEETIVAQKGVRLEGRVVPPLENVRISILNEADEIIISMDTSIDGKYKFGPLHSDHRYRVIGEKEGYILSGPFENGIFKAHKLAEVRVKLVDEYQNSLQGVLLSLSGGENYRQTSQSNADGEISFLSLKPSEYFLRPMLKEYKFSPPSKVINIKEGETIQTTFQGHRVLYSIFGSVFSLNRIPEKDIVIEALSRAGEECVQHQEEGTTDERGQFRIRGLHPHCEYDVRLKQASGINNAIYQTLPETIHIKMNVTDIEGIELIAVLMPTQCDVTIYIEVDVPEHMHTLQIKLMNDDGGIIYSVKLNDWKLSRYPLNSILLPFPTLPLTNQMYFVQLDSSLPKSTFNHVPQTVYFSANVTFHAIKMSFNPELKFSDGEIKHSYAAALFMILLAIAYYCRESIMLGLMQAQNNLRITLPEFLNRYSQQSKNKEAEKTFEFEPGLTVVKRKLKSRKT